MGADPFESDSPATSAVSQGRRYLGPVEGQSDLGSPIRFQVWLRHGLLGPAWSALCGALASAGLTLSSEPLLKVALLIFLVDVVWGGLWSGLVATDWATPLRQWKSWRRGVPVRFLPYTSPNGRAGHIARTLGQLREWWAELGRPVLGPTLAGLALLLPVALVVAGVLGLRLVLVTLAAITLPQLVFVWTGGSPGSFPNTQALFEIGLPWLAGHALFDSLSPASTLLGLAYALSYAAGLRLVQGKSGLARWNLGQGIVVIVLITSHQPLAAGVAGLLFIGQVFTQPGLLDEETGEVVPSTAGRFVRFAQPLLMAAMLAAALGVRLAHLSGTSILGGAGG